MKLNNKQRKVILIIMYIFIIVFLCYSIYNDLFTGEVLTIIGVFFLVICKKIYPDENIMKCFNTEIEVYNLKNSDIDSFLENIKDRYLLYEEMTDDFINVSVKKYLKVSGLDFFVKNKILVVIEASKLTLNVIDLIERIKNEYKENIPKFNIINQFFTDRFDLLIISDEVDEGLLHYLNSEVLSRSEERRVGKECRL